MILNSLTETVVPLRAAKDRDEEVNHLVRVLRQHRRQLELHMHPLFALPLSLLLDEIMQIEESLAGNERES